MKNNLDTPQAAGYETHGCANQYSIRVRTTDIDGGIFESQFTINIIDINDPPGNITLSNNIIEENRSPGAIIGFLNSIDQDDGDSVTFNLPDTTPDNSFFFH